MLHLGGRITLGVEAGNSLQLERAFERDREERDAAEEEHVGNAGVALRNGLDVRGLCEGLAHEVGGALEGGDISGTGPKLRSRMRPMYSASIAPIRSCEVNALVEATPISGPTCW